MNTKARSLMLTIAPLLIIVGGLLSPLWLPIDWLWLSAAVILTGIYDLIVSPRARQKLMSSFILNHIKPCRTIIPNTAEFLCLLIILGTVILQMGNAFTGDPPINGDHPVHLARADLFHSLLLQGRLFGWSNQWFAGFPLGYLYPIGPYLWTSFIYLILHPFGPISVAYALSVALAVTIAACCVYWVGRQAYGRFVGLLAALLYLTDLGQHPGGGWDMIVNKGTWPSTISTAIGIFTVIPLARLLKSNDQRAGGLLALTTSAALLMHPFQLMSVPLLWTCALLAWWLTEKQIAWWRGLRQLLAPIMLTSVIVLLWYQPFISTSSHTVGFGSRWESLPHIITKFLDNTPLNNTWLLPAILGTFGWFIAFYSRQFWPLFISLTGAASIFLASNEAVSIISYLFDSTYPEKVESLRWLQITRPIWFILAASLVPLIPRGIDSANQSPRPASLLEMSWLKQNAIVLVRCILSCWIIFNVAPTLERVIKLPINYASERSDTMARDNFVMWLNQQFASSNDFFRVALHAAPIGNNHDLMELTTRLNMPVYKIGWTPAVNFEYKPDTICEDIFNILSVRYVLATTELSTPFLTSINKIGNLYLYEYPHWRPHSYSVPVGSADISIHEFSNERIRFEAGPKSYGTIILHVAPFPRWQATRNHQPIPIKKHTIACDQRSGFMALQLLPGHYEITFKPTWFERWGWLFSLAAVIASVYLALRPRSLT